MNAIIALNPREMAEAQGTTIEWADQRITEATQELTEAQQVSDALSGASLRRSQAYNLISKARSRLRFYEKVKAALQAGYYIVPPFNIQLFAIRRDDAPPAERSERSWVVERSAQSLPVGEGQYVNPQLRRLHIDNRKEKQADGSTREVAIYENEDEWRDVALPVRALKPKVIEEVGRALELRIFDALGIAPAYRAADPIVLGEINRPNGGHLSFFVAWWLDKGDL